MCAHVKHTDVSFSDISRHTRPRLFFSDTRLALTHDVHLRVRSNTNHKHRVKESYINAFKGIVHSKIKLSFTPPHNAVTNLTDVPSTRGTLVHTTSALSFYKKDQRERSLKYLLLFSRWKSYMFETWRCVSNRFFFRWTIPLRWKQPTTTELLRPTPNYFCSYTCVFLWMVGRTGNKCCGNVSANKSALK